MKSGNKILIVFAFVLMGLSIFKDSGIVKIYSSWFFNVDQDWSSDIVIDDSGLTGFQKMIFFSLITDSKESKENKNTTSKIECNNYISCSYNKDVFVNRLFENLQKSKFYFCFNYSFSLQKRYFHPPIFMG